MDKDSPILYYNAGEEDKEAYLSILEAGIPCEFRAPAEEPTPSLVVGFMRYEGLQEIKKFIEEWKNKNSNQK